MSRPPHSLGQAQLEVLKYVTDHHPVRVSEVAEHFARTSGKARTTILTVMEKLRQKGYLSRRKRRGTYHYSPRLGRNEVMAGMVRRFIEDSLGGSVSPFFAYLAESGKLTEAELAKLRDLVRELDSRETEENS